MEIFGENVRFGESCFGSHISFQGWGRIGKYIVGKHFPSVALCEKHARKGSSILKY
jgi:hypothetical protein